MIPQTTVYPNPYIAGNPVYGDFGFYGRTGMLRQVEQVLAAPGQNVVVLFGQRRIGKTSILLQLKHTLPSEQYTVIYQDLQDKARRPMSELLAELAAEITLELNLEEENITFDEPGRLFQRRFLPKVYEALPQPHQRLVLLFDEFEVLDVARRERLADNSAANHLFPTLRRWLREEPRLAFVFALGRNLEDLDSELLATFKSGQQVKVSVLLKEDAFDLITAPEYISYTDQAVEKIYALTNGHPHFTQLLCSLCFDRVVTGESPLYEVTEKDVTALIPAVFNRGDNIFTWIWDGLPPREKITASALAQLLADGKNVATHQEIEEIIRVHHKRLSTGNSRISPELLVKWQLLQKKKEGYSFLVSLLRQWIQKEHPLDSVHDELDRLVPRADYYFELAKLDFEDNALDEAVETLKKALRLNPNHLQALLLRGDIHLEKGQLREAVEFYEEAYRIAPEQSRDKLEIALREQAENLSAKLTITMLIEASKTYDRIIKIDPEADYVRELQDDLFAKIEDFQKEAPATSAASPSSFDVFLSHSSVDKPWVTKLKDDLLRYGISVWLDRDEIRPGDLFAEALEQALDNCRAVALIVSPEAVASGWVREEYYRALSLSKNKQVRVQLIPVLLRDAQLPGFLQSRNWVDFRDETAYNQNVWKLVWGVTGEKPAEVLDLRAPDSS